METITFSKLGQYGRLGNAIWEAMSTYGMAKKHSARVLFPPEWEYREHCVLPDSCYGTVKADIQAIEDVFHYIPGFLDRYVKYNTVDVIGTFQSFKYFSHCEDEVRELFKPRGINPLPSNYVAIHIRRGDYCGNDNYVNYSPEYYYAAIEKYFPAKKWKFIICSDDVEYARLHFSGDKFLIEERGVFEDFKILCSAQNHIICNSSFGWCGAFLSGSKNVIHPKKLFEGRLAQTHNESDFWYPKWTCYENPKINLKEFTFIIPVSYDHPDRKENLDIILKHLLSSYDTNIIVGEQGGKSFQYVSDRCKYVNFNYLNKFHRTRMLNDMTRIAKTKYVVNYDCDVLFSPYQIIEMRDLLKNGVDIAYPYDGRFIRIGDGTYGRNKEYIKRLKNSTDVGQFIGMDFIGENDKSVGGAVGYNKERFFSVGGENENFIAYAPEDVERKYRFEKLGLSVDRVKGRLYHINHYCGSTSSVQNPYHKKGLAELKKIKKMSVADLTEYVKSWSWADKRKVYLLTYADEKYRDYQNQLIDKAEIHFDKTICYTREDLEKTGLCESHKHILDQERGGGYWLWKPYLIYKELEKLNYGDILMYLDSGDMINGDIRPFLLDVMTVNHILFTDGSYRNADWTKKLCFKKMDCDEEKYHNAIQLEAGIIVCKKSAESLFIINEWFGWCEDEEILTDIKIKKEIDSFKEHRHDQSILTNLKVKYNLPSVNQIRKYVTCNVKLFKEVKNDITFVIPLFYDGKVRKENIEAILKYYSRFSPKIFIGEQLDRKFEYLPADKYFYFDIKEFHRTRMINEMVMRADTSMVAICDADVIIPKEQYMEAIRLIMEENVDVVYPFNKFIKLTYQETQVAKSTGNYKLFDSKPGVNSIGGIILFNRESYIKGGMENEKFMVWGFEDFERYHRFKKLGFDVRRLDGNLYHFWHHAGPNSSNLNPYYIKNQNEFKKVRDMNKDDLKEYVKSWKKINNDD